MGDNMLLNPTDAELDELARIMRAEALSDGDEAMLMVGNVVVNRVLQDCLTFKSVNSIHDVIYQPNQFSGTTNSLYYAKSTALEKKLAKRVTNGEYFYPASNALWFYSPGNKNCKSTFYGQAYVDRYKTHCFYNPDFSICQKIH